MSGHKGIVARGIFVMALSILFVTLLSFALMRLSPINPAVAYVMRNSPIVTQEQIEAAKVLLGMDQPFFIQYISWIGRLLKGDLGISLSTGQPIVAELMVAVPVSLKVVGLASLMMVVGIISIGCLQYRLRHRFWAKILHLVSIVSIAVPPFYIAILFVNGIAFNSTSLSIAGNTGIMRYLPSAICLSLSGIGFYSQLLTNRLKEEMEKDCIYFARCRGLKEGRLIFFHALPSGVIDLIPSFAQMMGLILAGAVVVERVFSLPGFGQILIEAVVKRDAPLIHASVLVLAVFLVVFNFVAEMIQHYFNTGKVSKEG